MALSYDPLGRLFALTPQGGAATRFAHDYGEIIGEFSAANALLVRYVKGAGADETLVSYAGAGTSSRTFLHADERGSIIARTDNTGTPLGANTYDAYGRPGASNAGRFQYTGQACIAELGLYYYKARFHHPKLGRFIQTDPIGYAAGLNLYAYVGGDPVNWVDSSGNRRIHFSPHRPSHHSEIFYDDPSGGYTLHRFTHTITVSLTWLDRPTFALSSSGAGSDGSVGGGGGSSSSGTPIPGIGHNNPPTEDSWLWSAAKWFGKGLLKFATGVIGAAVGLTGEIGPEWPEFGNLSQAGVYGILPYSELAAKLAGTGLQAHHLIPQRFDALFPGNARAGLSIAVTRAEHTVFTNAWRNQIPYGPGTAAATRQQVLDAAATIYAGYPALMEAIGVAP